MKSFQCFFTSAVFLIVNNISLFGILCFVTEPQLKDLRNGHTTVGDDIILECSVSSNKPNVSIKWNAPINLNLTEERVNISTVTEAETSTLYVTKSVYTISVSKLEDQSIYYCVVEEAENPFNRKYKILWVSVYEPNEHFIKFYKDFTTFDQANAELLVRVRAHPEVNFFWIDTHNATILPNSTKFTTYTKKSSRFTNYETVLKFNKIFQEDFGNYTIVAENKYEKKTFTIPVNVTGPPSTNVKIVNLDEETSVIKCQSVAFPKPKIKWEFEKCKSLACFEKNYKSRGNVSTKNEFNSEDDGLQILSFTAVSKSDYGFLRAVSSNIFGNHSSIQYIYKVANGFEAFAQNEIRTRNSIKVEALFKEYIEIICAVSLDEYYPEIKWYRSGSNFPLGDARVPIKGFDEYHIKNINAVYSSVSTLRLNIDKADAGEYFCKASKKIGKTKSKTITVIVREQPTLNVASNMVNKTVIAKFGSSWKFYCNVDGYPIPLIKWYKNNITIKSSEKLEIKDNNQTLAIYDIGPSDNGTYKCEVSNRLNQTKIKVAALGAIEKGFDWLLLVIILLVCTLVFVMIFIIVKVRKENKLKKELKLLGLANFEEGAVEHLNPDLRLDDQADLLPYDKKWEVPAENLKLGKELGSGAFGVVVKGELCESSSKENSIPVAVKMVNKFAGDDCIRALASELKIMVHLGQHINIVNLIGACTQDIAKKKLLVVVEFCPFGNLQEHILYNSNNFVDQRRQDRFDWTIGSKSSAPKIQYTTVSFSSTDSSENSGNEQQVLSENNYSQNDQKPMCSQDFLVWAFQISKGMEYLSSRRVLHGDLAARNVLLSENNIVKISDFGLSRSMYKSEIYKKKANGPLPVKWMAVESIGENIFSTQSDVWSFGITLWELFSLAKTPYPGMQFDQNFYNKLFNGYRMEKPEFATSKIYEIMFECWNANPTMRPTFPELAERIGSIIEEPVKNHYMEMNSPYVLMNNQNNTDHQEDYLLKMSPPDFETIVPSSPHYANNITYFHSGAINMSYIKEKTDNDD